MYDLNLDMASFIEQNREAYYGMDQGPKWTIPHMS